MCMYCTDKSKTLFKYRQRIYPNPNYMYVYMHMHTLYSAVLYTSHSAAAPFIYLMHESMLIMNEW